jgi:hypothetical protein
VAEVQTTGINSAFRHALKNLKRMEGINSKYRLDALVLPSEGLAVVPAGLAEVRWI